MNTKENNDISALEIEGLGSDRHTNVMVLNQLMGYQPSPPDNLISNGNTDIKKIQQILHIFCSTQKTPHAITKMNNNINMHVDITMSRSVNISS